MTPSADDIFAAQFWAWPDPAIKRDPHGRVLFVNAAFLQLFGGSVQDWQGQTVQGWNPPQPGPQPHRFELKTPATAHFPEQVYDWIESCGQDGSGFAIARNVTAFVTVPVQAQPEPPAPVQSTPPVETAVTSPQHTPAQPPVQAQPTSPAAPVAEAPIAVAPPVQAPATEPVVAAPVIAAPVAQAPVVEDPIAVAPPANLVEVNPHEIAANQATMQVETAVTAQAVGANTVPAQSPATQTMSAPTPPTPPAAPQTEERDFERRALPIENGDSVLGNNWRDAVIAKAVGGDEGQESLLPGLAPDPTPAANKAKPDAIRILLAEDNAINALLTRTLLEADGHTVETVEDGALAVEAMKTKQFDMIFMDMRMPNMDGLEATRKIRGLANVPKDLPIVALTANAFDDDRNACFDSGMNDFMTKPVSAEELSEMVVRWTSSSEQKLAS